jgi:hypothetical protein
LQWNGSAVLHPETAVDALTVSCELHPSVMGVV